MAKSIIKKIGGDIKRKYKNKATCSMYELIWNEKPPRGKKQSK